MDWSWSKFWAFFFGFVLVERWKEENMHGLKRERERWDELCEKSPPPLTQVYHERTRRQNNIPPYFRRLSHIRSISQHQPCCILQHHFRTHPFHKSKFGIKLSGFGFLVTWFEGESVDCEWFVCCGCGIVVVAVSGSFVFRNLVFSGEREREIKKRVQSIIK